MKLNRQALYNIFMFTILMITSMLVSSYLQHEAQWDFTNYHYYNAWAFLNNRLNVDIVPASVNTFFNPLIELPLYFYIKYFNDKPDLIYALQGIWVGLTLFVFYKIYTLFFNMKDCLSKILVALALFLTLSGEGAFSQIGSSSNEFLVAFFTLWGLYILFKMIKFPETQTLKKFFISGLIMGIALGLKQTVITYCIASGLMLMILNSYLNKPIKSIFFFALGGLISYLIINGYFMWQYWILYKNPFFPFLNGLFHSPYFDNFNYRDMRFLPPLKYFLIYPVLWYLPEYTIRENEYTDFRLTIVYFAFISIFIYLLKNHKLKTFFKQNKIEASLYIFIVLSFFIWMGMFSLLRYALIIEILSVIWFTKMFYWLLNKKSIIWPVIIISIFIMVLTISVFETGMPHKKTQEKFLNIEEIKLPENTLLKLYGFPTAMVVPEFSKYAHIRALGYLAYNCKYMEGSDFVERGAFRKMRDEIESTHKGPIVIVYMNSSFIQNPDITLLQKKRLECEQKKEKNILPDDYYCSFGPCKTWNILEDALAEELQDKYFCRPLKNNFENRLTICVPKELKFKILGKEDEVPELNYALLQ